MSENEYKRFNTIVPRGDGKCNACHGTGSYGGFSCVLCMGINSDHPRLCHRCKGTGIDKFGAHCTRCDNNYEKYGARDNQDLM